MVNGARGEVEASLSGGPQRLCLTLGALAEIEGGLGVEGLEALAGRLRRPGAGDLAVVLEALLKGGGTEPRQARAIACACTPSSAAEAVAAAFAAACR